MEIVGVHSPEFSYEADVGNIIETAAADDGARTFVLMRVYLTDALLTTLLAAGILGLVDLRDL